MRFLSGAADFPPVEGDWRSPAVTNYGQGRLGLGLSGGAGGHLLMLPCRGCVSVLCCGFCQF